MPAHHEIDEGAKLITTTWSGDAIDSELIDSLTKYQQEIRSRQDYCSYDEIVDFSKASDFKISTEGVRKLVQIGSKGDVQGIRTKLALVVGEPVAYGLARMYEAYRSVVPSGSKEVRVFKKYSDALEWISGSR